MPNQKYLFKNAQGDDQEDSLSIYTSAGVADADKLVKTGADGKLDLTLLPAYAFRVGFKVRVASTANVTIATAPAAIDGVTLAAGNRILLKNQTVGSENGIYRFVSAGAPLVRAADYDESSEITASDMVLISEGTTLANQVWFLVTNDTITIGTTALDYQAWNTNNLIAGTALSMTGIQIDLNYEPVALQVVSDILGINFYIPGTDNAGTIAKAVKASDLASNGANQGANILGYNPTSVTAVKSVATRLQGAVDDALVPGVYYQAAAAITKGQPVYVSGNNAVSPWTNISAVNFQRIIGIAATDAAINAQVKVLTNDNILTGIVTGQTAGVRLYWTGSAWSPAQPSALGSYVYALGTTRNPTDAHIKVEFIKQNSLLN